MSEAKSEAPPLDLPADLRAQRDEFVQSFFRRGAELTEKLLAEHDRLLARIRDAERENAELRTQLESGNAIRDLLSKIQRLEADREELLATRTEVESRQTQVEQRHDALEEEVSTLANVYVAGQQLASTLEIPALLKHVRELLNQLVGSRSFALYLLDDRREKLLYLTGEAPPERYGRALPLADAPADPVVGMLERAVLAGMAHIADDPHDAHHPMAACIPMRFGNTAVGAIAIFAVLAQKLAFLPVDHELFRLLATQGTSFLFLAQMYTDAGRTLPSTERIVARAVSDRAP